MSIFQKVLLWIYQVFKKAGILENHLFRYLFNLSYFSYKRYFEDPFWELTNHHPDLFREGHILDIGANIGYTSFVFSKRLTPGYFIYAFEPEKDNFNALEKTIESYRLRTKVIPVQAAIGQTSGEIELWYNTHHHADHRVLTDYYKQSGIDLRKVYTVPMYSIDDFLESDLRNKIKFIKIDVQGYEYPVCLGMQKTLENNPDIVIALEYSPQSLNELGFNAEDILNFFLDRDYSIFVITHKGTILPLKDKESRKLLDQLIKKRGYIDLLFAQEKSLTSEKNESQKQLSIFK